VEVRAVEVQSSESRGGANYQKTWVTIESVVVCFGANTFHWLNVCLFEGFWTKATNKRFCSSLVKWVVKSVKSVATELLVRSYRRKAFRCRRMVQQHPVKSMVK